MASAANERKVGAGTVWTSLTDALDPGDLLGFLGGRDGRTSVLRRTRGAENTLKFEIVITFGCDRNVRVVKGRS